MAYSERAQDIPIDGPCKELANEVRRLLGWGQPGRPFLTLRMAQRRTGVSASAIGNLTRGDRVTAPTIARFAAGMPDADQQLLMTLAGYLSATPIVREPFMDDIAEAGFADLDPEDREAILADIRRRANRRR